MKMPAQKSTDRKWEPWDLWKRGVSWSFLDRFLRNRMECHLMYREGWVPRLAPDFIEFGQIFHHIMERGYRLYHKPPSLHTCQIMANGYLKRNNVSHIQGLKTQANRAAVVAHQYFRFYRDDFDWEWKSLERRFTLPYQYPDGKIANINGVIDAEPIDDQGRVFVLDTKTRSELAIEATLDEFPLNFQVNCYMYLKHTEGQAPYGCILNCVRRPGQRMSKADGFSEAALLARIGKEIAAEPKQYFARPTYAIKEDQILDWKRTQLDPIMLDVRLWHEGVLPTYVNPCGLYVKRMRSIYFDAMVDGDYTMLKRKT